MSETKSDTPVDVEMVPNPMGLDPARFKYDSQEVVLADAHFTWLRLTPMVMPVGVKVVVYFPDRSQMKFEG